MSEIVVLGAGAWGTALAIQAARAGNDVVLFARNGAEAIAATRESPRLPGHHLPEQVRVTGDVSAVDRHWHRGGADPIVARRPDRPANVRELLVCAKGIETGRYACRWKSPPRCCLASQPPC